MKQTTKTIVGNQESVSSPTNDEIKAQVTELCENGGIFEYKTKSGAITQVRGVTTELEQKIEQNKNDISSLNTELGKTNTSLGTANSNITALQGSLAATNGNIETLQKNLGTTNGNVETLQNNLGTTNDNVTKNAEDIAGIMRDYAKKSKLMFKGAIDANAKFLLGTIADGDELIILIKVKEQWSYLKVPNLILNDYYTTYIKYFEDSAQGPSHYWWILGNVFIRFDFGSNAVRLSVENDKIIYDIFNNALDGTSVQNTNNDFADIGGSVYLEIYKVIK